MNSRPNLVDPRFAKREPLAVFISYSRIDEAFAQEIAAGLRFDGGFEVLMDSESIYEGEVWKERLRALISEAHTVVFVLSPNSAASTMCRWEVDEAYRLEKRIVPVVAQPLGDAQVPEILATLNYVRFDPQVDGRPRSFIAGLAGLRRALNTDLTWLREHKRLLTRAQEWINAGRKENRLLAGTDIVDAKAWLAHQAQDGLGPTELHHEFISASEQAEVARLSTERQRADALQTAVKRSHRWLGTVVVLALVSGFIAYRAQQENQRADRFFRLVNSDPAGRRAMVGICTEAIRITRALATATDQASFEREHNRFEELYFGPMYIVELHQRKLSGGDVSLIERRMVEMGRALNSKNGNRPKLPRSELCKPALAVNAACAEHLKPEITLTVSSCG
jgi:TIR domain